jgi:hypothetical protein
MGGVAGAPTHAQDEQPAAAPAQLHQRPDQPVNHLPVQPRGDLRDFFQVLSRVRIRSRGARMVTPGSCSEVHQYFGPFEVEVEGHFPQAFLGHRPPQAALVRVGAVKIRVAPKARQGG